MKSPLSSSFRRRPQRGGALVTAMMITIVMLLLGGSILKWSMSERQLNVRAAAWLEARNAAEAVAEYGFSQIIRQFDSYATPPTFDPAGSNALNLPPSSFFSSSGVVTGAYHASTNPYGMEVIGGTIANVPPSGSLFYIDPANPNNEFDKMAGSWVFRRDVQVLARATVQPTNGSPITAYVTQKVSVRGAPLFAYAIFYNANDLEASPGPPLDIYGPVHVNGNMFPLAQGTVETNRANHVNFHGKVTMTGDLFHAWATTTTSAQGRGYSSSSSNLDGEPLGYDPVRFANKQGTLINLQGADGKWYDSTMGTQSSLFVNSLGRYTDTTTPAIEQLKTKLSPNFRAYASQTWGGNVQTSAHEVGAYRPISFSQPIDDAGTLPDPHAIIEAPTPPSGGDPYFNAKREVENQKFANQSGLYVQVTVTPGTNGNPDTASIKLYGPANSAPAGTPANLIGPNGGIELKTGADADIVDFVGYSARAPGRTRATADRISVDNTTSYTGGRSSRRYRWISTRNETTGGTITRNGTLTLNGSGEYNHLALLSGSSLANNASYSGGTTVTTVTSSGYDYTSSTAALNAANSANPEQDTYTITGTVTSEIAGVTNAQVDSGMYDQRQESGVNLVKLDMKELREALQAANSGTGSSEAILTQSNSIWGSADWNGGVYVEVKSSTGSGFPGQTSVALANGKVSNGSSLLPQVNNIKGVMIATNAPMYVLGHFNADGSNVSDAASATTPDDGITNAGATKSAQVPVALAADAITVLSPGYFGSPGTNGSTVATTNPSGTSAFENLEYTRLSASGSTEVAAAFITGIVPTANGTFSGGVHNLPRFIEHWGSNSVAIRGSLVSLYSSKVATGPWAQRYYSAPRRVWGFDQTFANGTYPPLTPRVMSYRRVEFTDLSPGEYSTKRHELWPSTF